MCVQFNPASLATRPISDGGEGFSFTRTRVERSEI
jgi:hypothetical protein